MRGRRLIVLFFDLSSMQPEEAAARGQGGPRLRRPEAVAGGSDRGRLVLDRRCSVDQDFTADRELLLAGDRRLRRRRRPGIRRRHHRRRRGHARQRRRVHADDTEFNIFNTDRRLDALQTLADELAGIEQKKSVIYFSSGMSQQGTDNQVQLRRTVDRANRANVSIYAADMRGLQAMVPGGDATHGQHARRRRRSPARRRATSATAWPRRRTR